MTGINASKIIQNLQFVHSFAPHHCPRVRCSVFERRNKKKKGKREETFLADFYFFDF